MSVLKQTQRFLLVAFILIISTHAFAQKKNSKKTTSKSGSSVSSGTIGLGVKVGDPTGLSIKFYQPASAIELVVGRPYYFSPYYGDYGYYEKHFYKYDKFNSAYYPYYHFKGYQASNPVAVQLHFLKSKATKNYKNLSLYYGGGPQFRAFRVEYYYWDDRYRNVVYTEKHLNYDLGLDGVFGLEYTFSDIPLSISADANLFLEVLDEVTLSPQGGIGIRYNLK